MQGSPYSVEVRDKSYWVENGKQGPLGALAAAYEVIGKLGLGEVTRMHLDPEGNLTEVDCINPGV